MVDWTNPEERRSNAFRRASSSSNWNGFGVDVVVGPGGQAFDLVLPVAAGGEDQDREGLALRTQLADQVQAAHARQAEVDHRQVVVVFADPVEGFLGIRYRR